MELKKQIRLIDLVVAAGKGRQSERTRFVHQEEMVPIYENFCFAFALFRQKTTESVTEGKELLERLLAFQAPDGNFPLFLHDYPRCFDHQMGLRVAPLLIYLLRQFGSILGDLKLKIEESLKRVLVHRPEKPLWENRYRACVNEPLLPVDTHLFSAKEWTEWLITAQLAGQTHFSLPYDPDLQLLITPHEIQEKGEPQPNAIEWLLAEGHYSSRLLRDHPHQLWAAPLFPLTFTQQPLSLPPFRQYWKGSHTLHTLSASSLSFSLPEGVEMGRNDLFEALLFTNASPETQITVNGCKATTFQFEDTITIATPARTLAVRFSLTEGTGDFFGHIFKANRPAQIVKGYESFDWQIGVRTLRRSPTAQITVTIQ